MHKRHYLLLCCGLLLIAAQAMFAQNFSVPLRLSDGSGTWSDTLTIGVNAAATTGRDAALGEEELPPVPPLGVGDARVTGALLGQGQKKDFHPTGSDADTFIVALKSSDDPLATRITLSWDSNISTKGGGGWTMEDVVLNGGIFSINMNGQTSYQIPATYAPVPQNPVSVRIIVADAGAFRSFNSADIVAAVDIKGKAKIQSKKPVASECAFTFAVPAGATQALVSLGQVSTYSISQTSGWSSPSGIGTKVVTYTWGGPGDPPATLTIEIGGNKGKASKAKATFNTTPKATKIAGTLTNARLLLLFPNLQNLVYELYGGKAKSPNLFGALGAVAGVENYRKSVYHPKYGDIFKTLNKKGILHTGGPKCLDAFANGKPIGGTEVKPGKPLKGLPPDKHSNVLLAEQVALKVNLASSDNGFTTAGLGDLVYVNPAVPALDEKSVRAIAAKADSVLSCLDSSVTPAEMYAAVSGINNGFRATLDTVSWSTGNVVWTSVVPISAVPILKRVVGASPIIRNNGQEVSNDIPYAFELNQNYPNPFNPTTTIEFTLAEDAFVSVKIYNLLGQEVATLADREEMFEGSNSVEFDATGLPSGIYYYRLTVNDGQFTAVNKMMLMK